MVDGPAGPRRGPGDALGADHPQIGPAATPLPRQRCQEDRRSARVAASDLPLPSGHHSLGVGVRLYSGRSRRAMTRTRPAMPQRVWTAGRYDRGLTVGVPVSCRARGPGRRLRRCRRYGSRRPRSPQRPCRSRCRRPRRSPSPRSFGRRATPHRPGIDDWRLSHAQSQAPSRSDPPCDSVLAHDQARRGSQTGHGQGGSADRRPFDH